MTEKEKQILIESLMKVKEEVDTWWGDRPMEEDLYGMIVHFLVRAHKIGFEDGSRIVK